MACLTSPYFGVKKTLCRKKKSQRGKHSHPTQPLAQGLDLALIVQFQKISILSPQKGLEFPGGLGVGGGGSGRSKNIKKCMKIYRNFQRGGEVLEKNPFCEGGMDIFWNYTLLLIICAVSFITGSLQNRQVVGYIQLILP